MRSDRRGFGAVVLTGLVAAGLVVLAGDRPWAAPVGTASGPTGPPDGLTTAAEMPVAAALGLVLLATWGVLLVTRGRVRRGLAGLGVLVALGTLAAAVVGLVEAPDSLRAALVDAGREDTDVALSGWWWAAVAGALVSVAATAVAVVRVPGWPEMGARYDAPSDRAASGSGAPAPTASNAELWRALDEGRDPTG